MGRGSSVSRRLGGRHQPAAHLGSAYHMDPFLLAIQVPELVGTDVDQGAQVTVVSTGGEKGGWAQARVARTPWPGPANCFPTLGDTQGRPTLLTKPWSLRAGKEPGPWSQQEFWHHSGHLMTVVHQRPSWVQVSPLGSW